MFPIPPLPMKEKKEMLLPALQPGMEVQEKSSEVGEAFKRQE